MSEPHSGVDPFQLNSLATRKNNGTEHTIKKKKVGYSFSKSRSTTERVHRAGREIKQAM